MYKRIVVSLTLFALLTILLGACAIVDTANNASLPTVHMGGSIFIQTSISIHKGDSLNLVDDAPSTHVIVNGSWDGTTQKPAVENGAPMVNKTYTGNDSGAIGPFTTAGTFHLYCTVHPGMNLTVTVQ